MPGSERIRYYILPQDNPTLTREELQVALNVNSRISPTMWNYYQGGQHIICSSQGNQRAGYLRNDEASFQWLEERGYVRFDPPREEILT